LKNIFVSYAHNDYDFAEVLKANLEQNGFGVWLDSSKLQAGQDWRQGIDDGIKASDALVVVMSPDAMQSPYVTYEWAFAYGFGVPVIPLLYKKATLHPRLETLQYLDFTSRINRPWQSLVLRLQNP
jgi:hypothetical protein